MGEVYLGEQVSLGRKVAIKVLHADLMLHPSMIERFKREARLLSAIEHPAVVRVIDYGEAGVGACLVMEYVEGENLYDVLQAGAMAPSRALPLLYQLAEGLAAIHDKGIIHRDLKPENVLLTKGLRGEQARLLDFGIARLVEPEANASNLSQVGLVVGTPEYLSPEQAVGAPVDTRSDLYSFGVLAYRVLDICTGDLGQSHHRSFDLEVYAPGVDAWLEVSSVSWFSDYQARRANLRWRREPNGRPEFPHTLNGSGLALPRVLIAILETYQQPDGSVRVPDVLLPYMGGIEVIEPSVDAR